MNKHQDVVKSTSWLILIFSAALLIIWPIPETIALRHLFLVTGFFASCIFLVRLKYLFLSKSSWPLWVLIGLYAWLLLHLVFFSRQPELQINELKNLWLRSLIAIFIGISLGLCLTQKTSFVQNGKQSVFLQYRTLIVFLGLSGTSLISFWYYTNSILVTNHLINFDVLFPLYKAKTPFVISTALFAPLCFVLLIEAINKKVSGWWIPTSFIGITLSLFSCLMSNTKNGMAVFVVLLVFFIITLLIKIRWCWQHLLIGVIALIFLCSLFLIVFQKHIDRNPALKNLTANIMVGVDIDHQNFWKDRNAFPQPINEYGLYVDISTYERTAWFTAGTRLLKEHVQGFGLVHHSFGWLALEKWPDFYKPNGNLRGATHSGWMDMALGIGIPGVLLIWIPLFVAWYRSMFQEGIWFSYTSWTIPIMMFAYLIAEVAGAHFTEILLFMTAFFCGITLLYPAPCPKTMCWNQEKKGK